MIKTFLAIIGAGTVLYYIGKWNEAYIESEVQARMKQWEREQKTRATAA